MSSDQRQHAKKPCFMSNPFEPIEKYAPKNAMGLAITLEDAKVIIKELKDLNAKLDHIFGGHVLIHGQWVNVQQMYDGMEGK